MFSQTRTRSPIDCQNPSKASDQTKALVFCTHHRKSRWGVLTVPRWDVLVGDTGSDIEHDDTALAVDIVTISETTEFLLASSIPHVKLDSAQVLWMTVRRGTDRRRYQKGGAHTVVKARGWTSTPRVAMYFFSNSPVRWRFTKVVW